MRDQTRNLQDVAADAATLAAKVGDEERTHRRVCRTYYVGTALLLVTSRAWYERWPHAVPVIALDVLALAAWALVVLTLFGPAIDRACAAEDARATPRPEPREDVPADEPDPVEPSVPLSALPDGVPTAARPASAPASMLAGR
jgi:hypothetical protein